MRQPRICCLDLDTFFVSVERLKDPSLIGQPVIVGASPGQRGVVLAASYEVRALGVHSGMSMADARRLAPQAMYIPPGQDYSGYAARVRAILDRYCPVVQAASIDEFLMDFHGCERLYARQQDLSADATLTRILHEVRATIRAETGLPASAGIGCTRIVAKMASGLAKPHQLAPDGTCRPFGSGVVLIPAGRERAWFGPLPVRRFPGIGPAAEKQLQARGLYTLEDVLSAPSSPGSRIDGLRDRIEAAFDQETAHLGRDRPAFREHDPAGLAVGSISNERTFPRDLSQRQDVDQQLLSLVERVCWRARNRRVLAKTVCVKLKYKDFQVVSRSKTAEPSSEDSVMLHAARQLLADAWFRPMGIRLVGVSLSNLVADEAQLRLPFGASHHKSTRALDLVRDRFGFSAIGRGRG